MKSFSRFKVALISDDLTRHCLKHDCRVWNVIPWNYELVLGVWKPDVLFVESAWRGYGGAWRYGIAAYPDRPQSNNKRLSRVVDFAKSRGIPAVFWNREDGVHFERFIESAKLFDRVFTVDEESIPRYKSCVAQNVDIDVLMFAAQPAIHFPVAQEPLRRAAFVGSYGSHVHTRRREWQDKIFRAAEVIGLTVYDRNSNRRSEVYRYPRLPWMDVRKAVPHPKTAEIYRRHIVNVNVNTIEDSSTAFSRRLVEILATGGFAVSNATPAVKRYFEEYCTVLNEEEEARQLFSRIAQDGLSPIQREQARAAADYILGHHTWRHRLEQVAAVARG